MAKTVMEIENDNARLELLKVSASLLRIQLSDFSEDWNFSNSTPKKDIRKVLSAIRKHNDFQRRTAIHLKTIYDKLTFNQ